VTLSVRPGHYTLLVNIEDRKSGRSFLNRDISLAVEALPPTGLALISLFFAERRLVPDADATPEFVPLNRGADLLFGAPAGSGALVQLAADSSSGTVSVRWELTNTPDLAGLPPVSFTDSAFELYSGIAVPDTTVRYLSYRIAPSEGTFKTLFIPLPFEKLQVGTSEFSISLSSAGGTKKHKGRFRVLWLQQPLSLQDLNLAIDALQHIVGEKEMDALFSVSRNERAKNFARFWRERDRDTTTAYNEVMAEYYRRVDEAIRAYSSANETDGYKTDRGRVFILYGTPTHTRRFLEPGEPPREVWTYQHLQRRFIFTDVRKNGQYRLTGSEPL
jgi:GWxTD domain-containing protein